MTHISGFAAAPLGLLHHGAHELRERHCHDESFVAVVLKGGYQEAGDEGRWNVRPGHALIHHAFESHLDRFDAGGARVLILALPKELSDTATVNGRIADPDHLVRLAERDARAASTFFAETFVAAPQAPLDWPDLLADDLRRDGAFSLTHWASRHDVRPETLSRGFRRAYGCTPKAYRAHVRARAALAAIRATTESLATIAHRLHFTDQAHMTRAVALLTGSTPQRLRQRQLVTIQR
ncbi:MAG: helix-turn-helix domain-containing protein [Sphingopyxis sp.]|nr:helix-turn-helix domain-containing protein [Sphingopyxis sp.]